MSRQSLEILTEHIGDALLSSHALRGDETATIEKSALLETCRLLRDNSELAFDMLADLTAVDYLEQGKTPRFEVVYHLYSTSKKHRIRIKVGLADGESVDTISKLWRNADWLEREVWDLYGIRFEGHPNLKRILLYEAFEGHPLRKDYPKDKRQPLVRRPQSEIDAALEQRS